MALDWIVSILRLAVGLLFVFSGIVKMFDLKAFSVTVAKFGMMKRQYVKPFAYALPPIEAVIGILLLVGYQLRWSALAAALLVVVSNIGIGYALMRKKKIDNCGCFGAAIKIPVTWNKFNQNLIWLAFCIIVFWSTFQ